MTEEDVTFSVPSIVASGESVEVSVEIETDIKGAPGDNTVKADIEFSVGGNPIGQDKPHERLAESLNGFSEGSTIRSDTTWQPEDSTRTVQVSMNATLEYFSEGEEDNTPFTTSTLFESKSVGIKEELREEEIEASPVGNSSADSFSEFYENRTDFSIDTILYDSSAPQSVAALEGSSEITFNYKNPSISVDSGARFVKHELIGTETVRQKIGQEPLEITVNGACFRDTARKIDGLRYAQRGTLRSDRFDDSSIDVRFASASTDPMEDGSAVSLTETNEIFTFTINCTEVL